MKMQSNFLLRNYKSFILSIPYNQNIISTKYKYVPQTDTSQIYGFNSYIIVEAFKNKDLLKKYKIGKEFNDDKSNILDSADVIREYNIKILDESLQYFKEYDLDFNKIDIPNKNYLLSMYLSYENSMFPVKCYKKHKFKLEKILSSGVQGSTYKARINDFPFVIKLNTSSKHKDDTIREAAVGSILNTLYKETPNFMYFYTLFNCSITANNPEEICTAFQYPGCAVFEYINGDTLYNMINKLDNTDIINIYCQILLSLHIAYTKFKYTHYDIHTNNVMVVKHKEPINLYYILPNGYKLTWKSMYVAKIIDYGYSYIETSQGTNSIPRKLYKDAKYISEYNGQMNKPNHQFDFIRLAINLADKKNDKTLLQAISHIINVKDTKELVVMRLPYFNVDIDKDDINYSALSVFDKLYQYLNVSIINYIPINYDIPDSIFMKRDKEEELNLCETNSDVINVSKNKIYLAKNKDEANKSFKTYDTYLRKHIKNEGDEYNIIKNYVDKLK